MEFAKSVKLLGLSAAVATAAMVSAPQVSAQEASLRLHTFVPAVARSFKNLDWWAKKVEKESNNRIQIKLFPSRQLGGKPSELYDQARKGFVDIIYSLPGYTPGRFPRLEVVELPFVSGHSPRIMAPAIWSMYDKWFSKDFPDTHPIVLHAPGPFGLFSHKPINGLDDLKGLKIRVSGRTLGQAFKTIGATPVGIPGIKMAEAFQRNVIDAVYTAWTISLPTKIVRVAKHYAMPGLSSGVLMVVMNKDSYNKLPADLKKVIDNNSGAVLAKEYGERWHNDDTPALNVAKKSGKPMYVFSDGDKQRWAAASEKVVKGWIADMKKKGIDGAALLADMKAAVKKFQ